MIEQTIFALASGAGRAGVAVFRLSGTAAGAALSTLTKKPMPVARRAVLRKLYHPGTGDLLDEALVLFFAAPHSFTGEDVVELHTHGGRAVTQSLLEALSLCTDCRLANPGEFSRRAFENDRLDLTQTEAIADLVNAETMAQARQALSQMQGHLSTLYKGWAERLTRTLAHVEAYLDFPDEDLPEILNTHIYPVLKTLCQELDSHLNDQHCGERLRDGFRIAIIGAPNVGKSSLLNLLAKRDVAIVSDQAGTTRDLLEVHLDLGGYPVTLADTAGLRDAPESEAIEREGIRRAKAYAQQADFKLMLFEASDQTPPDLTDGTCFIVFNKSDLAPTVKQHKSCYYVSAKTGDGIDRLLCGLQAAVARRMETLSPPLTRLRHRTALQECRECLSRALVAPLPELAAEDLRLSVRALGRITGTVDVEDLLDVIFRDFCIGK